MLKLAPGTDAKAALDGAEGDEALPGSAAGGFPHTVRLNHAEPPLDEIEAGIERLAVTLAPDETEFLDERPRDHEPLDLVGALADREDLRVAIETAHRVFLDVAVAAVDLNCLVGDVDCHQP